MVCIQAVSGNLCEGLMSISQQLVWIHLRYLLLRLCTTCRITSNHRQKGVSGVWVLIFVWAIVNITYLMHDDDLTFTSMDTKIGSPTFHT